MQVSDSPDFTVIAADIPLRPAKKKGVFSASMSIQDGVKALYFRYQGEGSINFHAFELK